MLSADEINQKLNDLFLKLTSNTPESKQASIEYVVLYNKHLENNPRFIVSQFLEFFEKIHKDGMSNRVSRMNTLLSTCSVVYFELLLKNTLLCYPVLTHFIEQDYMRMSVDMHLFLIINNLKEKRLDHLLENENDFENAVLNYFIIPSEINSLSQNQKDIILNTQVILSVTAPMNPVRRISPDGILKVQLQDKIYQKTNIKLTLEKLYLLINTGYYINNNKALMSETVSPRSYFQILDFDKFFNRPNLRIQINFYTGNSKTLLEDSQQIFAKQLFKVSVDNDSTVVKKIRMQLGLLSISNYQHKITLIPLPAEKVNELPKDFQEQKKQFSNLVNEIFGTQLYIDTFDLNTCFVIGSKEQKELLINLQRLSFIVDLILAYRKRDWLSKQPSQEEIYLQDTSYQSSKEFFDKKISRMNDEFEELTYYEWIYQAFIKPIANESAEDRAKICNDYAKQYQPVTSIEETGVLELTEATLVKILIGFSMISEGYNIPFINECRERLAANQYSALQFAKKAEEQQCIVTVNNVEKIVTSIKNREKQSYSGSMVIPDIKTAKFNNSKHCETAVILPGLVVNVNQDQIVCGIKDPLLDPRKLEVLPVDASPDEIIKSVYPEGHSSQFRFYTDDKYIEAKLKKADERAKGKTYALTTREILLQIQTWCKLTKRSPDETLVDAFSQYQAFMCLSSSVFKFVSKEIETIGGTVGEFIQKRLEKTVNKIFRPYPYRIYPQMVTVLITTLNMENIVAIEAKLNYNSLKQALKLQFQFFKHKKHLPIVIYNNEKNHFIELENIDNVEAYLKQRAERMNNIRALRELNKNDAALIASSAATSAPKMPAPPIPSAVPKTPDTPITVEAPKTPDIPIRAAASKVWAPIPSPSVGPKMPGIPNASTTPKMPSIPIMPAPPQGFSLPLNIYSSYPQLLSTIYPNLLRLPTFELRMESIKNDNDKNEYIFALHFIFLIEIVSNNTPLARIIEILQKQNETYHSKITKVAIGEFQNMAAYLLGEVGFEKIISLFRNDNLISLLARELKYFHLVFMCWYDTSSIKNRIQDVKDHFLDISIENKLKKVNAYPYSFSFAKELNDPDILINRLLGDAVYLTGYFELIDAAPQVLFTGEKVTGLLVDSMLEDKDIKRLVVAIRYCAKIGNTNESFDALASVIRFYQDKIPKTTDFKEINNVDYLSSQLVTRYYFYLYYFFAKLNISISVIHPRMIVNILALLQPDHEKEYPDITPVIEQWLSGDDVQSHRIILQTLFDSFVARDTRDYTKYFICNLIIITMNFSFESAAERRLYLEKLYVNLMGFVESKAKNVLREIITSDQSARFIRFLERVRFKICENEMTKSQFIKNIFNPFLELDICNSITVFHENTSKINSGLIQLIYKNFGFNKDELSDFMTKHIDNIKNASGSESIKRETAKGNLIRYISQRISELENQALPKRKSAPNHENQPNAKRVKEIEVIDLASISEDLPPPPRRSPSPSMQSLAFFSPEREDAEESSRQDSVAKRMRQSL